MPGKNIRVRSSEGGDFDCYLATPRAGGKVPAIVLASAVHGVNADIRAIVRALAERARDVKLIPSDLTISDPDYALDPAGAVHKMATLTKGRTILIERLQFHRVRETIADLPDEGTLTNSPANTITNGSINKLNRWYAQDSSSPRPSRAESDTNGPSAIARSSPPRPEGHGRGTAIEISHLQNKPTVSPPSPPRMCLAPYFC